MVLVVDVEKERKFEIYMVCFAAFSHLLHSLAHAITQDIVNHFLHACHHTTNITEGLPPGGICLIYITCFRKA